MYQYNITTGDLIQIIQNDGDSVTNFIGTGYSGAGLTYDDGRNNPDMITDPDKGPIPPGQYTIIKPAYHHPVEGPCVMNLQPLPETNEFGRSGFHIHGNNARNDASLGCIIFGPAIRQQIADSADNLLNVIAR